MVEPTGRTTLLANSFLMILLNRSLLNASFSYIRYHFLLPLLYLDQRITFYILLIGERLLTFASEVRLEFMPSGIPAVADFRSHKAKLTSLY